MKTLMTGGAVFDGENLEQGLGVLIEDGRVARVAPAGEFTGFDGEVTDTTGATVMPGMIDCHVHLCLGAEGDPGTAQEKLSASREEPKIRHNFYLLRDWELRREPLPRAESSGQHFG